MSLDKVIVTNLSALRSKYGARYAEVRAAVNGLIAADRARGLTTRLVAIDSAPDMRRAGGLAVPNASSQRGAKAAVDAIFARYSPDYVLILGAPDVVPHIDLQNPFKGKEDDDGDASVPSDVAYACATPWSRNPKDFLGPTRVVGRLPDVAGTTDPSFLIKVLGGASRYVTRDRSAYSSYLAFSAKTWHKSTELSVSKLFGPDSPIFTSPPSGPKWTKAQLARRIHFINCHGDTISSKFFGEYPKDKFFDAHDAARLPSRITEGSVVAAECCYGAELYDPSDADGRVGICSVYLAEGAYGFFGSSNVAYGPTEGNGQADLICQYFIENVLNGASLGRAALEARQRFIAGYSHLDPSDLKTAVQFNLLGDPSIHAVKIVPHAFARSATMTRIVKNDAMKSATRAFRRERIARVGENLSRTIGAVVPAVVHTPAAVRRVLLQAARESGIIKPSLMTYSIRFPSGSTPQDLPKVAASRRERSIHVVLGSSSAGVKTKQTRISAIIATVEGQKLVHIRRVQSR